MFFNFKKMFGSVSTILDIDSQSLGDATKVQPKAFFQLLQSMSSYAVEPMQILGNKIIDFLFFK